MMNNQKDDNPLHVITSDCNAAVENLSNWVQKTLYHIVDKLPSKIKDTEDMLDIIDSIKSPDNHVLQSFILPICSRMLC